MTPNQLRQALTELNGQRAATFAFHQAQPLTVNGAMLVPEEDDHLIKLTDGQSIYLIEAESVAWVRIGLAEQLAK